MQHANGARKGKTHKEKKCICGVPTRGNSDKTKGGHSVSLDKKKSCQN